MFVGALTPEIDTAFLSRGRRGRKRKRKVEEGPDCSPSNSWPVTSLAITSRPRFFTYEVPRVVSCYQPIYQNRSVLLFYLPFFLPWQDRSNSPFPFRCFYSFLFLLSSLDSRSFCPVACNVFVTFITPPSQALFDRVKWNEDFIFYY